MLDHRAAAPAAAANWPPGAYYRRRGVAAWAAQLADTAPRRFCRHVRFVGWDALSHGEPSSPGRFILTAGPLWPVAAAALGAFHRPVTVVADHQQCAAAGHFQALPERRRHLTDIDPAGLHRLLAGGESVLWVLGRRCLQVADSTAPVEHVWGDAVADAAISSLWIRTQLDGPKTLRLVVAPCAVSTVHGTPEEAMRDALGQQLAADPASFPWEVAAPTGRLA